MSSNNTSLSVLKEHGALLEGHFLLASGKHSGHYLQAAMLTQHPSLLRELMSGAVESLGEDHDVEVALTAAVGGIAVVQQVGQLLGCRSVFAERNERNRLELRRNFWIKPGENLLLVEDVVTTGGTLGELKQLAEENEARPVAAFTLFNRSGMDRCSGLPLASVFDLEFPVYDPENCPICARGTPIHRPGTKDVDGSD